MVTMCELAEKVSELDALCADSGREGAFLRHLELTAAEPFAEHLASDLGWLSAVALGLAERLGDEERALELVEMNQAPSLESRGLGFEAWEVAAFLEDVERKRLRHVHAPASWGTDNPVSFRHAACGSMLVLKWLVPEGPGTLAESERDVREAVDADAFEGVLAASMIAIRAGEMERTSTAKSRKVRRRQANRKHQRPNVRQVPDTIPISARGTAAEEVDRLLREYAEGQEPTIHHLLPPHYDPHEVVDAFLRSAERRARVAATNRKCAVSVVAAELFQRVTHFRPRTTPGGPPPGPSS